MKALLLNLCFFATAAISGCPDQGQPEILVPVVNKPVVKIYAFTATWCGPCQRDKPKLAGRKDIVFVDIDKYPKLKKKFRIRSIPTYVVLHDDVEVFRTQNVRELPNVRLR